MSERASGLSSDRAAQIAKEIVESSTLGADFVFSYNNFLSENTWSVYNNAIEKIDASGFAYQAPNFDGCEYMPCILGDGTRRYIKKKDESFLENRGSSDIYGLEEGNLLQKPIQQLISEAENRQIKHIALMSQKMDDSDSYRSSSSSLHKEGSRGTALWVDKYAPNSFSQLLSPEKINREVLKSLKAWDDFVFKKAAPVDPNSMTMDDKSYSFKASGGGGGGGSSNTYGHGMDTGYDSNDSNDSGGGEFGGGSRRGRKNSEDFEDKEFKSTKKKVDKRPRQKLILLSGAPGTGKTTLAHILARHCGYRPHEINASDDRSEEKITNIIFEATQSNTINGDALPNCLILDEIDGIDNRKAIDAIIDIVKTPLHSSKTKGGKKDKHFALLRPIICICNDMYAPVLKDLRQHCVVFNFTPPLETRLVARLKQICTTEGLPISSSDLTQLCSSTGHDIRSSINTLQFASIDLKIKEVEYGAAASRGGSKQSVLHEMLSSGLKDDQSSAFFIWNIILSSLELGKHMHKLSSLEQASEESFSHSSYSSSNSNSIDHDSSSGQSAAKATKVKLSAVDELMRLADEFGDNALIMSGIFENRLSIHYSDPTFMKTDFVSEWMSSMDTLDGNFSEGNYSSKYSCALFGVIHCVSSSDKKIKLQFPRKDREMRYNNLKCKNILRSLQESRPDCRSILSNEVSIMDLISYLIRIISPQFKSHTTVSFSEADKKTLDNIVNVMSSFGLSFTSTSKDRQTPSFELEPPINYLVSFKDNKDADPIHQLTPEIKVSIIQEIKRLSLEKSLLKISENSDNSNSFFGEAARQKNSSSSISSNNNNRSSISAKTSLPLSQFPAKMNTAADASISTSVAAQAQAHILEMSQSQQKTEKSTRVDFFAPKKRSAETASMPSTNQLSVTSSLNQSSESLQTKRLKVAFKFNKGFSNAVKRPVTINDFI